MSLPSVVLLRTQSDERLVALARSGHERAFEAIVRRYRRPLLAACRRMVPEARAEDALQQGLVLAWRALERGDEVRDLRAWLFRVIRNAAVSNLRQTGHEPPELLDTLSVAPSPQEEIERRAVVQETLEAVAGLPARQREALLQIAVQGRSQHEVADELGVSAIAVRQLVHRARSSLRAAASAAVPFPLVTWLASVGSGSEPMSLRIAQLIAGAGGAGAAATVLKAGAVAGVAATAVSAPMLAERHRAPPPAIARTHATPAHTRTRTPAPRPTRTPAPKRTPRPVVAAQPVRAIGTPAARHASPTATPAPRHVPARTRPRATPEPDDRPSGTDEGARHDGRGGDDDRGAGVPEATPVPAQESHDREGSGGSDHPDDSGGGSDHPDDSGGGSDDSGDRGSD